MTAPRQLLSPSSILPPPSSHRAFAHTTKNSARASKMLLFKYFYFKTKQRNLNLRWNCASAGSLNSNLFPRQTLLQCERSGGSQGRGAHRLPSVTACCLLLPSRGRKGSIDLGRHPKRGNTLSRAQPHTRHGTGTTGLRAAHSYVTDTHHATGQRSPCILALLAHLPWGSSRFFLNVVMNWFHEYFKIFYPSPGGFKLRPCER